MASNFSDFFFFFHFQGLKSLPSICILVFLCAGGVAEHTDAAEPTFSLSHLALFDFFPETRQCEKRTELKVRLLRDDYLDQIQ